MSGRMQKDHLIGNRDLRPRPLVRPTAPPLKVMPKQSAPPRPVRARPLRKMASPVSAPPRRLIMGVELALFQRA